jgi:alkaline phosphatase
MPSDADDPEYQGIKGVRGDDRDLIKAWQQGAKDRHYVWNDEQLRAIASSSGQLLGLFDPSHLQFDIERVKKDGAGEPSLAEMTRTAIERLSNNPQGFFLMVEGGKIDHAHHAGNAHRALTDTIAFADAVAAADGMTSADETLILVTADHSHTFTIAGYPKRGNPILGKVEAPAGEPAADARGRPYTTLGYANGPGFREELPDLSDVDTTAVDFLQVAGVPMESETHGGEDVAAYARGPNAAALRGVLEQNRLYNIMADVLFPSARSQ